MIEQESSAAPLVSKAFFVIFIHNFHPYWMKQLPHPIFPAHRSSLTFFTTERGCQGIDVVHFFLPSRMTARGYAKSPKTKNPHALDSWVYGYVNAAGNRDNINIEINYSLRAHILPPEQRPILSEHFSSHDLIKTLAPVEIFAGKINALLNRAAARDLYDVTDMIRYGVFDESEEELLRKCVVFYAAISAQSVDKGFSTTMLDRLTEQRIRTDLLPVLRRRESFDLPLAKRTIRAYVSDLMRLAEAEVEFLERFENREFRPELLFDSEDILSRLAHHPMALWKTRRM